MKVNQFFLLSALALFACASLRAQVTIGGLTDPAAGALLDLNSNSGVKGGLLLSNVTITDWGTIPQDATVFAGVTDLNENLALRGAMVYNTGSANVPQGIYIWNGCKWTQDGSYGTAVTSSSYSLTTVDGNTVTLNVTGSGCPTLSYQWFGNSVPSNANGMPIDDATNESYTTEALSYSSGPYYYYCKVTSSLNGSTAVSDVFTVTVDINPESIAVGTGAFIGRNCFDVAMQNNNAACGLLSNRAAIKTLFTNREKQSVTAAAPYSGVQEYVFSPSSGTVSNVRFISVEESGSSIESLTPQADYSGGDVSIASVVVAYKSTLNTDLAGKIRSDGNKVKLYVIYNDASNGTGTDKRLSLNISLQDYVCCDGAWIENGAWDYADGTPGDWAKDINWSNINDYYNQAGTPNPRTGLSGVYNNTTAFNSYFKSSASGGLCWYKKEMLESHMTWPNAISKCADDTWTDGKDTAVGGWYLPNLKELDYLYRNLPDGSLGGKRVGSAEFFGGSDGARPLYISLEVPFWSSTESDATNVYTLYFGNGERKILNKRTPTSFFPGVTRCVRRF